MTQSTESVVGMKPGKFSVVIGYQGDEFTHTWSAECFVAWSHIYPGFKGQVSSQTYFMLEPGCEDYSFMYQAVADFEQGCDSILTDSFETPKQDATFEEPDGVPLSFSSGFLDLISTI